ncbi:MAG: TonB-dependent receptor plug domain-containing protein [Verrucomicrobiota bacterium]|nr:TonB-dependent receptor plug domain-containing protein [Verrucomicrobiota bacterium]
MSVTNIALRTKEKSVMKYFIPKIIGLFSLSLSDLLGFKMQNVLSSVNFIFSLLACIIFAAPNIILAEDEQSPLKLERTTIIATKTPKQLNQLSPGIDLLDESSLNVRQIYHLEDALNFLPGISMIQTGQMGGTSSLFVRGQESNHLVTLLNGRRLAPGLAGLYNIETLDIAFLDSVELARGPVSSLYGSDALAGALNLRMIDARFVEDSNNLTMISEAGSFRTVRNGLQYATRKGKIGFVVDASHLQTENDRPESEFDNLTLRNNFSLELSDEVFFDILSFYQTSDLQVPGSEQSSFFPEPQINVNKSNLFSPRISIFRNDWDARIFYSHTNSDLKAIKNVFLQDNILEQIGNELEAVINFYPSTESTWTIGTGYYKYEFARTPLSPGPFNLPSNKKYKYGSIFAQTDATLPRNFHFIASARWDEHDSFESEGTYSVQINKRVEGINTQLFGKVSTGYKAPSGQDFVFLDPSVNPDLISPEKSIGWEIGIRQFLYPTKSTLSLTYFKSNIDNLVDSFGFPAFPAEVDTEIQGIELGTDIQLGQRFSAYANYTWLDAVISEGLYFGGFAGGPGDRLPRRPENTAAGGLLYQTDNWKIGAEIRGASNRLDGPELILNDYAVTRLYGTWKWKPNIEFFGRIENVFDKYYETTRGFTAAGLGAFGGIKIQF